MRIGPAGLSADLAPWYRAAMSPKSIAIVGASADPEKSLYMNALLAGGYTGDLFPVNPTRPTVLGHRAYPSLADLPAPVDLVIVMVPASVVLGALADLWVTKARCVYVGTAGFAELGTDGRDVQARLVQLVSDAGARLIGPNGNGTFSLKNRVIAAGFSPLEKPSNDWPDHGIAIVTQSGAVGASVLATAHRYGVGIGTYISTGNEADISASDAIRQFALDESVNLILAYLEGIDDGPDFLDAVDVARRQNVPVIGIKVGASEAGAAGAASHTASLAGDQAVYEGLADQAGLVRVSSCTELVDVAQIRQRYRAPIGPRAGAVSFSGGMAVMLADSLERWGFSIPAWSDAAVQGFSGFVPGYAQVRNPLDATGEMTANTATYVEVLSQAHQDSNTDFTIFAVGILHQKEEELAEATIKVAASNPAKPFVIVWIGSTGKAFDILRAHGIPCFSDVPAALAALAAIRRASMRLSSEFRHTVTAGSSRVSQAVMRSAERAESSGLSALDEVESKRLLSAVGIRVPREVVVSDRADAERSADEVGYPLVAKLLADDLTHKSDVGGVILGIRSRSEAVAAVAGLLEHPIARTRTVSVVLQEQIPAGTELLLGAKRDRVFGWVLVIGIGGTMTEAFSDSAVLSPDHVTVADIEAALLSLQHQELLAGFRGLPEVHAESIAASVQALAGFIRYVPDAVSSVDVNPLVVVGEGPPVAVDSLMTLHTGY